MQLALCITVTKPTPAIKSNLLALSSFISLTLPEILVVIVLDKVKVVPLKV